MKTFLLTMLLSVRGSRKVVSQSSRAKLHLGSIRAWLLLYEGKGAQKDYAEAVKWYRKAAEQGDSLGQLGLGECYDFGHGVEKDYAEAYA